MLLRPWPVHGVFPRGCQLWPPSIERNKHTDHVVLPCSTPVVMFAPPPENSAPPLMEAKWLIHATRMSNRMFPPPFSCHYNTHNEKVIDDDRVDGLMKYLTALSKRYTLCVVLVSQWSNFLFRSFFFFFTGLNVFEKKVCFDCFI